MSEATIPKERLSAYQRWEMASFDPVPETAIDPLEAPRAQARLEGFAEGHQAGRREGFEIGRNEGFDSGLAEARDHALRFASLANAFTNATETLDAEMADSLLALALEIARTVVRQTVETDPTMLLGAVREVLSADPPLVGAQVLLVNPADQGLLDAYLAAELAGAGWSVRVDPSIAQGGCKAKSHSGEIDATLATRWARVAVSLGRDCPWQRDGEAAPSSVTAAAAAAASATTALRESAEPPYRESPAAASAALNAIESARTAGAVAGAATAAHAPAAPAPVTVRGSAR